MNYYIIFKNVVYDMPLEAIYYIIFRKAKNMCCD